MHIIYCLFLFIVYLTISIDCQGGGGGGGGHGSGGGSGGGGSGGIGYHGGSSTRCPTNSCQGSGGIADGIIIGGIAGLIVTIVTIICCCKCCKGRAFRKNTAFVKYGKSNDSNQVTSDVNIFPTGVWSSRYFQYRTCHGPYRFLLSFDPRAMTVTGSGADNIGTFFIDGTYSVRTRRIGLTKTYQLGTGNPLENLGHQVTIQLMWNAENNQFEGKWYVRTRKYRGEDKFELMFHGQHMPTAHAKV